MEELLKVMKKQLFMQRLISGFLAVLVILLLAGAVTLTGHIDRMAEAMQEVAQKVDEIDVESINGTIEGTEKLLQSIDNFSDAVDHMTDKVNSVGDWFSGLLGGN